MPAPIRSASGRSSASPASDSPPPSTISCGSSSRTQPIRVRDSAVSASSKTGPGDRVALPGQPDHLGGRAPAGRLEPGTGGRWRRRWRSSRCSRAGRTQQGSPSGMAGRWPISPARLPAPETTRPPTMLAAAMPVPMPTNSASGTPRAAPSCASARPAARTSCSMATGSPTRRPTSPRRWRGPASRCSPSTGRYRRPRRPRRAGSGRPREPGSERPARSAVLEMTPQMAATTAGTPSATGVSRSVAGQHGALAIAQGRLDAGAADIHREHRLGGLGVTAPIGNQRICRSHCRSHLSRVGPAVRMLASPAGLV